MNHSIRPVKTFVLRLWHEPGAQAGDAGWRGLIRPLNNEVAPDRENEAGFHGLENLLAALRPLLIDEEPATPRRSDTVKKHTAGL